MTTKMIFHFTRVLDTDIPVEAETVDECVKLALAEREKQCKPMKISGDIIE